jgi:hypothetical protein
MRKMKSTIQKIKDNFKEKAWIYKLYKLIFKKKDEK